MDRLWSPWRFRYVSQPSSSGCIFCQMRDENRDEENLILCRRPLNFVVLNRFPYTSGHLMVVPNAHVATLSGLDAEAAAETMMLTREAEGHLRSAYKPDGINLGMNIGASAGAGVAGHIHMHVLPRWAGDVNFMTTVAETRVLPEALETSYEKLRPLWVHT